MQTYNFEFSLEGTDVARESGVIRGVSIITSGVLAKGHDLEVDRTTLVQMQACAKKKKRVPVKWNHKTGADAVNGYLNNFRIEGSKLKADWHLLRSHERYDHAMELAEEMPECVGLSASFMGQDELADGSKVITPKEGDAMQTKYVLVKGEKVPVMPGEKVFARCTDLVSVDLVATPAANPDGLFEAKVDSGAKVMADNLNPAGAADAKEFSLADVMAGIQNLGAQFQQLAQRQDQVENFFSALADDDGEDEDEDGEGEDADDDEGEGEGGEGQSSELHSLQDGIRYLEARLNGIEEAKERAASEHAFAVVEDRVGKLLELNAELTAQNAAMAAAIHEFSAHTGGKVEFSAGADGGYDARVTVAGNGQAAPRTEFQVRVQQLKDAGKDEGSAIMLAMQESPARYQKYLQEIGVSARTL